MRVWPGRPAPLGATCQHDAVNVAVFAGDAVDRVEACFFDDDGAEVRVALPELSGGVWHGAFPDVRPGARYGFRVQGRRRHAGDVWNPAKLLLDPYARAIDGDVVVGEALLDNDLDSASSMPRSVVHDDGFDWAGDAPPDTPWHETVLYEAHVRGLTLRHPGVPEAWRGTYLGVSADPVVEHLSDLGVTAVELLPVHQFVSEPHLVAAGLTNYWGYNSIGYFAPHNAYVTVPATVGGPWPTSRRWCVACTPRASRSSSTSSTTTPPRPGSTGRSCRSAASTTWRTTGSTRPIRRRTSTTRAAATASTCATPTSSS
jgi:glycogen operon protein